MNPDGSPQPPAEGTFGAAQDNNGVPVVSGVGQSPTPIVQPQQPAAPVAPQIVTPIVQPTQPSPEPLTPQPSAPGVMPQQTVQPTVSPVTSGYGTVSPTTPTPQASVSDQPSIVIGNVEGSSGPTIAAPTTAVSSAFKPKRKLFSKSLLIILAVIVVLGGGSAAAYVGVIVPNKPQNVLKSAIVNSLQQTQLTLNGNVQASSSAASGGVAAKVTFTGETNTATKDSDLQMSLTISGITFPVEARLVDGNLYFKLGDVSSIVSILNAVSPEYGSVAQSLAAQVSNQWFVVDSTLIDESPEAECLLNTNLQLTKSEDQQIENLYSKNQFVTIKSTSSAVLNGTKVEKMNLVVNNNKFVNYAQSLTSLSLVKQVEKCSSSTASTLASTSATGNTDVSVWVNKAKKQIVQIGGSYSNSGDSLTYLVGLNYGPVSISAPANAKPVLDLITTLESSFGGSTTL